MPIKVSDFIQNIAAYPVLRVQDNTILGYAYSADTLTASLQAVPINNRRAGLLLAGRALFHYDLANVSDEYWAVTANHKEIATRFSSYPEVPYALGTSVAEYLADPDNDGDIFFAVHNNATNLFYKLSHNDIISWIVNALIQAQVGNGAGTVENYSSSTGLVGDFDNNGTVGTSDLLIFLQNFGATATTGTYLDTIFNITTTSNIQLLNASGGGATYTAYTKVFFELSSGNVGVTEGSLAAQLNTALNPDYISFKDNAVNGLSINQFIANVTYVVSNLYMYLNSSYAGYNLQFGVRVTKLLDNVIIGNSADVIIQSTYVSDAGSQTINYSTNLFNINDLVNQLSNPFGANNGYLNDLFPGGTGYDEVRFSFFASVPIDDAGVQSLTATFKLTADPTP